MKKIVLFIIATTIIASYVIIPLQITEASKAGIMLWFNNVFPTLFPCIIISNLLLASNILNNKSSWSEILIILCGFILGFPIGAKLTADFYKEKIITEKQAQFLLIHTNHFSYVFISSYALNQLSADKHFVFLLYFCLYVPYMSALILYLSTKGKFQKKTQKTTSRLSLNMQNIDAGIINGFESLVKLCGYIVFFSIGTVILKNLLNNSSQLLAPIVCMLEATSGISLIKSSPLNIWDKCSIILLTLSLGGLSCIFQTKSIICETNLSIRKYIRTKLIYGSISVGILQLIRLFLFIN